MYKIAAIIGGVLLMAGVAFAGTVSSLGSPSSPTIGQTIPTAGTTVRQEDRSGEAEARGRANEVGEDLSGPCDEAEHANDAQCTGVGAVNPAANDDDAAENEAEHQNRGPGNNGEDHSGPGRGQDDNQAENHSGHGNGNDDAANHDANDANDANGNDNVAGHGGGNGGGGDDNGGGHGGGGGQDD
jgi:hypothetical protein